MLRRKLSTQTVGLYVYILYMYVYVDVNYHRPVGLGV